MIVSESVGSLWARCRRTVVPTIRSLPPITRAGLAVLLLGFVVDLVAHLSRPEGPLALTGHLVTLAGMVLAVSGVLGLALRRPTGDGPDGRRSR